jgi:branched-chain amino acid transport system permease protein
VSLERASGSPGGTHTVLEDFAPGLARRLPEKVIDGLNAIFKFWEYLGPLRYVLAGLLLAAIALPIDPGKDEILVRAGFYALAALGLNVVVGLAGLLDLGYVAFLAIGAYTTAFVTASTTTAHPFIVHAWVALPFAVLVAMLTGILLGTPTLRLRGDYLAIVTLGFHEIVRQTAKNLAVVNGSRGVGDIPHPDFVMTSPHTYILGAVLIVLALMSVKAGMTKRNLKLAEGTPARRRGTPARLHIPGFVAMIPNVIMAVLVGGAGVYLALQEEWAVTFGVLEPQKYWFVLVVFMMGCVFMVGRLKDSRIGRAWEAIREDEVAAAAMGIPVVKMKLYAFSIGASTSGLAGWALATKVGFINPDTFPLLQSILVLCAVVIGGIGSSLGALLGAAIVFALPELLRELGNTKVLGFDVLTGRIAIFGILLVVMMIFRPGGVVASARRRAELGSAGHDIAEESAAVRIPGE